MKKISRRKFIGKSSLLAAATTLPLGCSDDSDEETGLSNKTRSAVVIGSGFAGSVAALRLGQAGIPTIVLERGNDTGKLEDFPSENVNAVCGSCLGGGSLVYGGVLIQPQRQSFETVFPYINYDDMDGLYYPRVIREIGASPIPDDVLSTQTYQAHRTFLDDAAAVGYTQLKPYTSFDWNVIRREIAGEIPAEVSIGNYAIDNINGAKLSTDKNYLKQALATSAVEVRTLTEVEIISERNPGGYAVLCRRVTPEGEVIDRYELEVDYVFMAAGSMNTSKLLLKSQQKGELRGANDRIGHGWGTNGDQLLAQNHPLVGPGPQGGPACVAALDQTNPRYPVTFMHSPVTGVQLQMAMSVPDETGRLNYDAMSDTLLIDWNLDSGTPSEQARVSSFGRLLDHNGGEATSFIEGSIWHPLGGVPMNDACDDLGRLYGYENLFVVDGSLLPGTAAGVNPALTIAANAERIMEAILPGLN